jgi:quinol monooxygenase YgiN
MAIGSMPLTYASFHFTMRPSPRLTHKEDTMRQRPSLSLPQSLLFVAALGIVLGVTVSASAEPILRLVTFTVTDSSKQDQAFQLASDANKLFVAGKGFQWLKFSYDPATGQNMGVSLWDSQAAMEAVTQTDAFKALLEKLKPLTKGDFTAKTYQVHELKK